MIRLLSLFLAASTTPVLPNGEGVGPSDETGYWLYAAAESADEVYMIRFDGRDAEVVQRVEVGYQATEIEGPHGLTVSPDCLLYTSPSPRDKRQSRMPSSA